MKLNLILTIILGWLVANSSPAQTEVMAWSNITGIRVDGQLMEFETSIRVVGKDWTHQQATGKERRPTKYDREGNTQTVIQKIGGFEFTQIVSENGKGSAVVTIKTKAEKDTVIEGLFFCIELPERYYSNSTVRFRRTSVLGRSRVSVARIGDEKPVFLRATGFNIVTGERNLDILLDATLPVALKKESNSRPMIYIGLTGPEIKRGTQTNHSITINAGGVIDDSPVEIVLEAKNPGARFDGFGGNFRLQNPKLDPQVIRYCLDNMRVAWGRVEMPWQLWHPDENTDPTEAAKAGEFHPHVQQSMEMAQTLAKLGIPVIVSDWFAPPWAILGDPGDAYRFRNKGIFGYRLNPEKTDKIYKSIADYLVYLKQEYGVEAVMFSFNESDLGIDVRHTAKEHAEFIKGIGAYFALRGIATKLLLGDNSDATTFDFIIPAMEDPETHKYIGAISFHSWRGCDDATLKKWAGAARKMNLPVIIGEGSTDAAAWNYPEIFFEQTFALYEINLYMRLCSFCQPLSILQWQLTSDYSPLAGEGIFGTEGPLRPTRRFWNLKQLASTPEGSFSLPFTCDKEEVNCAAFGNIARGEYAVHMVNNGAARKATIKGIPAGVDSLTIYITDESRGMENIGEIPVVNGTAELILPSAAFISILN